MSVRGLYRGASAKGVATPTNAPVRIDSSSNTLKYIPAGSGSTEVEIVDASTAQTLTGKTLTSPTITTPTITGAVGATGATFNGGTMNASAYKVGGVTGATGGTFATGTFAITVVNGIVTVVG